MEEDEDEAVLQKRLSTWSLDRLKEAGYCLTELSAYWMKANQFGRPVASFTLGPGIMLPEHRFEYVHCFYSATLNVLTLLSVGLALRSLYQGLIP